MSNLLELKGLNRRYALAGGGQLEVLRSVDLELKSGEMVGLIGPSGSGKSSLLHCVGLLESSDEARLMIDGIDLTKADDALRTQMRLKKIGFVYQFHHLLPEFSAMGNVELPQRILGLEAAKIKDRARYLLKALGLGARLEHRPAQLSGGEQQRVAIARAMANHPRLLLCDEPTGNLDPTTSMQVFEALKSMTKKEGIATLIATHNHELASHMDRVLALKDGKLVAL